MYREIHDRDFAALQDRREAADAAYVANHKALVAEAVDAWAQGGAAKIANADMRLALADWMAGDDARTDALIAAIQSAADGKPEARAQAMAVIATFARVHADFYAEVM